MIRVYVPGEHLLPMAVGHIHWCQILESGKAESTLVLLPKDSDVF